MLLTTMGDYVTYKRVFANESAESIGFFPRFVHYTGGFVVYEKPFYAYTPFG